MKMTTQKAIQRYNALSTIERGKGPEKPYDLTWETLVLIAAMMNALEPIVNGYQKARNARFKSCGGSEIRRGDIGEIVFTDPLKEIKFREEEEHALEKELDVYFPTDLLDLNLVENKPPPSLLAALYGMFKTTYNVKTDEPEKKAK